MLWSDLGIGIHKIEVVPLAVVTIRKSFKLQPLSSHPGLGSLVGAPPVGGRSSKDSIACMA